MRKKERATKKRAPYRFASSFVVRTQSPGCPGVKGAHTCHSKQEAQQQQGCYPQDHALFLLNPQPRWCCPSHPFFFHLSSKKKFAPSPSLPGCHRSASQFNQLYSSLAF